MLWIFVYTNIRSKLKEHCFVFPDYTFLINQLSRCRLHNECWPQLISKSCLYALTADGPSLNVIFPLER